MASWQALAQELLRAIDRLEAATPGPPRAILLRLAEDLRSIELIWCDADGMAPQAATGLRLALPALPAFTDRARDDARIVPNHSIDRAISKAAAEMLSWSTDPESFELLTHQRHALHLRWPGATAEPVNEYAYGLWDE